jgi:hypothetical protein
MKLAAVILTLLLAASSTPGQTLIGIYEGASSGAGDNMGKPGVRVLFKQSGRDWRSFNATCNNEACLKTVTHVFPHTTTWTLVQSGKVIAKVTADTPLAYRFYSEIGVQAIANPAAVANLEPRRDQPHTILATTLSTLTDPDNWKPFPPVPLDFAHTQQAFRKLFPHPINCDASGQQLPRSRPWTYADGDIHLNASYQSSKNWRLVEVTLSGYRCDGPPDAAFLDQWFAISPIGEVRHIGRLMHLAGAADFAHDGHSALLFSNEGENDGGYKLFYENFSRQVQAKVTHH